MTRYLVLACLVLSACVLKPTDHTATARSAVSTCVTVQRGLAAPWNTVADAMVNSSSPITPNGSGAGMTAGAGGGITRRGLVSWDLSAVPSGSTVVSATAGFWINARSPSPVPTVNAHANTAAWSESAVTWNTAPAFGATVVVLPSAASGAITAALPVATVQAWITGAPNAGLTLEADAGGLETLATSEDPTPGHRPSLTVCYDPPGTGPSCSDGVQNQDETGVDCGGLTCAARCGSGQGCASGSDCAAPLSCIGGVCGLLADGAACTSSAQCQHGICGAGVCQPVGGESVVPVASCARAWDKTLLPQVFSYGTDPAQALDFYTPPGTAPAGGWPLMVVVHGGGFTSGSRGNLYSLCQVLATPGNATTGPVSCASIDYRLMTGHYPTATNAYPTAVNDGIAAQAWLVANAATLNINPARIGWLGVSAGGHIACKVGKAGGVKSTGLWYSNLYFDQVGWWSAFNPAGYDYLGCAAGDAACVATKAPAANCSPSWGDPPAMLAHGAADTTVLPAMSTRYLTEAHAAGVNATLVTEPAPIGHGFNPINTVQTPTSACTLIDNWIALL